MRCKRCGKALPSNGIACNFCGMLMDQEQINMRNKLQDKDNRRIELLSEKYGKIKKIEYQKNKENKILGLLVIIFVLLFLIILAIIINVISN